MRGQDLRLIDPTSSLLVIIIFHVTVSLAWPVNPENHAQCIEISIRFPVDVIAEWREREASNL